MGKYSVLHDTIWFLGQDETGTKWNFEIEPGRLTLKNPEDFKYLGSGNYIYYQFSDPIENILLEQQFEYDQEYVTNYFENGNRKTSIIYIEKGKGIQNQWYLNGKKEAEINFQDGKLHGEYVTFFEDGAIAETYIYENGRLVK